MKSQTFDLFPVLTQQFESDPGMDYIDIGDVNGSPLGRVQRADWEREKLSRDLFRLMKPIGSAS